MTEKEFWHSDMRLLGAYRKAYLRKTSYEAWLRGNYNEIAFEVALGNLFAKKGQPKTKYISFKDPIAEEEKPKITKENLEVEFRKQQIKEHSWFNSLIHNNK